MDDTMGSILKWLKSPFSILAIPILILFLPLNLLFKLLSHTRGTLFPENVAGKVVLITGASSGIGEHLAYEYAKRGARLGLAARRVDRLQEVATRAQKLGSPDVIVVCIDVSKVEDCKRFIDEAVNHFGQVDHLVNNAGISRSSMDTNFFGSVHCTHYAIPYLKKSKGKILGIASIFAYQPIPQLSSYNASKAALVSFYETLRVECGSDIGITIAIPGLTHSEIVAPQVIAEFGAESFPIESTEVCAKKVVEGVCRGDLYLTVPLDNKLYFWIKTLYPELLERLLRWRFKYTQGFNKDA
ncbi:11-beta-hydroxysteroid dehydrogenase-like 4A isoform X2 [Mercurialis annua]|uniref:11-beta-hydroxysteroid dehydrogenase-like 4A isoform X2 n=1 Tax=Mercurialis annua TaxID=3986 RepID=UPI00216024DB|nr:11-beta-hydroxysteroid dehydrogenase-like 4A isoform X2 [Mercurialis annua]